MNHYFNKTVKQVMEEFSVARDGLSETEAEKRLQKFGENKLKEKKKKMHIAVFLDQFRDLLVVILAVAAIISVLTGSAYSAAVIVAVLILNAVLGTVQHFKAEKSLEGLASLSAPSAKVMRDGQIKKISASKIVPGDVLLPEAGDIIVADARIIENHSLKVNESALTGESVGVEKICESILEEKLPVADQKNMVFSGSLVTYGNAVCVAVNTGMNTEIGKIAALMNTVQEKKTPLQKSLDQFSRALAIGILCICALIFILEIIRSVDILNALLLSVALAVAAIPEALSSIVTIVQALGTQKMVKQNAIVKELSAVESLGAVSVICSDKTGTLTQNKMKVQQIYVNGALHNIGKEIEEDTVFQKLLMAALLTNDAQLAEQQQPIGDPTEVALLEMGKDLGIDYRVLQKQYPRMHEFPFDSDRKMMSTVHFINGKTMLLVKGAPDVILDKTAFILSGNGESKCTSEDKASILKMNQQLSEQGLRVLALAQKQGSLEEKEDLQEEALTFIGLVSMMDPLRDESKTAVSQAKQAGIRTVMITGDHPATAAAIAKRLGILGDKDKCITGMELDQMEDETLSREIGNIAAYARVSPAHKIRIVRAWQSQGKVVAMTGDGVNDAPALKQADIGIAMGITGTEVSKDAAAMILTDDHFATIVKAIANGRSIFQNIKNAIGFLLSGNAAGILAVLYTALMPSLASPFAAVQLLFMNLLTDSLPALAIGMEQSHSDVLRRPPRDTKKAILDAPALIKIVIYGILIAAASLCAYGIGLQQGGYALGSTMAFATICLARLFHGFNCRGDFDIFYLGLFSNKYSVYAFVVGILLLFSVLFVPPLMNLFAVVSMSASSFCWVLLLAFAPTFLIQIYKFIDRKYNSRHS